MDWAEKRAREMADREDWTVAMWGHEIESIAAALRKAKADGVRMSVDFCCGRPNPQLMTAYAERTLLHQADEIEKGLRRG